MLWLFASIKEQIKRRVHTIDNWIFKLHYRVTTIIFLIATILVTSREYIGEHIRCLSDDSSKGTANVIERFCFFTSTFSVVHDRELDKFKSPLLSTLHIGLGSDFGQKTKHHFYYQWVPFLLFGQAIMFYLTHMLWKKLEGGRLERIVACLDHSPYAILDTELEIDGKRIPKKEQTRSDIMKIKKAFMQRIIMNKSWAMWFVFCELLNVVNVALQAHIIHLFIGRQFYSLGSDLMKEGPSVLDKIFPKLTKCTFHKYGPSGSIQSHDALCVMALNIINEKIYVFLWFWLLILFIASCFAVLWRISTILLFSRSIDFNRLIFGRKTRGKLQSWSMFIVAKQFNYADWLLLKYLSKNMHSLAFEELFFSLAEDIEETKPIMYPDISTEMADMINLHKIN